MGALAVASVLVLVSASLEGRAGQANTHPPPETFHWVLPAQYGEVNVVDLHPGDCYVIRRADGVVSFEDPDPGILGLQRTLGEPLAHRVDTPDEHPECRLTQCLEIAQMSEAIATRLAESAEARVRRVARHLPTPLDGMRGGAYTDVGSAERSRYRQAPEQRMAYRHLRTAARDNCYEAEVPRTLTIHIRDSGRPEDRTGVYSGYLYLEHHHPAPHGVVVENRLRLPTPVAALWARAANPVEGTKER